MDPPPRTLLIWRSRGAARPRAARPAVRPGAQRGSEAPDGRPVGGRGLAQMGPGTTPDRPGNARPPTRRTVEHVGLVTSVSVYDV